MPRNRYTREVRELERKLIEQRENELVAIEKRLRNQPMDPMETPLVNENKVRRSTRVEQKRRHKAKRQTGASSNHQK